MKEQAGAVALIADVQARAAKQRTAGGSTTAFVLEISEAYAFIRLQDWRHPLRCLKQMAGAPPVQFGTHGFRRAIVDDQNPARHYTAFVFVGYWLPTPLALLILWAWETLGFFRYRGHWSQPDIRCGAIGIRHGRQLRRHGPTVLADLIARDLVEN